MSALETPPPPIPGRLRCLLVLLVLAVAVSACCCSPSAGPGGDGRLKLKVIVAGSLLVPIQALEKEFERLNPDVDVQIEGHGSVQVIRNVTELGKEADLVIVADAQLIPLLMYSTEIPGSNTPFADWSIRFATNRLGIAYQPGSAYSSEIDAENWPEVLSRTDVTIGLADPRIDAMGYRSLMLLQMAADYYGDPTLFERTIGAAMDPPPAVTEEDGTRTIVVPEIVRSTQSRVKLRGYSIQLMALLESGDLDYSFEYESVARQRQFQFLALPPAIDLSSLDYEEGYRRVNVRLDFRRFSSLIPDFVGTRITYALTIPKNAPHPEEAARLAEFLLGPDGRQVFAQCWQPLLPAPECDRVENLPAIIRALFD